ncbi:MAG: response regulator [Acidobacteriota bacterium]|nr:response regulator [Acidobacteriota bacterium]
MPAARAGTVLAERKAVIERKSVLLVEDDSDLRFAVVDALHEEGYAVVAAANGKEAIERLLAETPCVVLLDM